MFSQQDLSLQVGPNSFRMFSLPKGKIDVHRLPGKNARWAHVSVALQAGERLLCLLPHCEMQIRVVACTLCFKTIR